ncbi:MAG: MarR family transcriptional regulator [Phreatobacter sp.]|uniref:MarR family winged helix-turn-helix transcriptional regulator n=1 Tax=Phreatobacter sp. TaxID=1966341 RepID=UPI001A39188F|nr:MarR family transcriptional regulator [Phreatobacter sp.]
MRQKPAPVADLARFDVANRLFFRLYQSSNLMHKNGTRAVSGFGSTTQQWAVLGALARPRVRKDGMSVKELIAFLMVSRQNLAAVLDRLEARGWIEKIKDAADGRARRSRLTVKGTGVWNDMLVAIGDFYEAALADFRDEEQLMLYRLLDRLKDGLGSLSGGEDDTAAQPDED